MIGHRCVCGGVTPPFDTSLPLGRVDYFDHAPTPDDAPRRQVLVRTVDGDAVAIYTGLAGAATELCERLAVELTAWRMARHARRLRGR